MAHSRRPRRSSAEWQMIIQQQVQSDLSARQFCLQQDIGYGSFCKWRQRLTTMPPVDIAPLIDLSHLIDQAPNNTWHIELDLGDGLKLNLRQR